MTKANCLIKYKMRMQERVQGAVLVQLVKLIDDI